MLKYRVLASKGTPHVCNQFHFSRQALPADRHATCPAIVDVQRPTADELMPASIRRPAEARRDWAGTLAGRKVVVACVHGQERGAGRRRHASRSAGVDAETLEGGFAAWREAGLPVIDAAKLPPRDAGGPHDLGHPRPAQGRPDRLPLADPPLRRSGRHVPVRRARRKSPASPSGSEPRRSTSTACSGAIAASICTFDTMVEELGLGGVRGARSGWRSSSAAPTPRDPRSRRRRPGCSPPRSACRACMPTISSSSRPGC